MIALRYLGDGDFKALRPKQADAEYVIGEVSMMEEWEDRSDASHRHEFGWLREAWKNLPEQLFDDYPTPTHLRKAALIEAGFFNETIIDCGDRAGALRVAAQMQVDDEFAHIVTRGNVVVRRTAKSQRRKGAGAMDKRTFQESKDKILEIVSNLIGVAPDQLKREAA